MDVPKSLLAVVCGLTAANLYYCQAVLPLMAATFAGDPWVGALTSLNQVGYALALVLVVPLGDIVSRRPLIRTLFGVEVVAVLATAAAPSVAVLLVSGVALGVATAGVVQILVSYAATLAPDGERGRAVGTVLGGTLTGVVLSRTVAGLVAQVIGWRALFLVAAVVTFVLMMVVSRTMPPSPPEVAIGYRRQFRETVRLAATEPVLRRRSAIGACVFGTRSAFWATIAFLLAAPPYHFLPATIGLFLLLGALGGVAARVAGRAADRGLERPLTGLLLGLGVAAFLMLWLGGASLPWLIAGLVAGEISAGGVHLLNMSVAYALVPGARARIAAVYMTAYTSGGVLGAGIASIVYRMAGWPAVCLASAGCLAAALIPYARAATPSSHGCRRCPSSTSGACRAANCPGTAPNSPDRHTDVRGGSPAS